MRCEKGPTNHCTSSANHCAISLAQAHVGQAGSAAQAPAAGSYRRCALYASVKRAIAAHSAGATVRSGYRHTNRTETASGTTTSHTWLAPQLTFKSNDLLASRSTSSNQMWRRPCSYMSKNTLLNTLQPVGLRVLVNISRRHLTGITQ